MPNFQKLKINYVTPIESPHICLKRCIILLMNIKLINLQGETFELTFQEEITLRSLRKKLLQKYNYNTDKCYFCISGHIIENEVDFKETFAKKEVEIPIMIFNYKQYPDKSYPRIDNAIQFHFSRYSNSFSEYASKTSGIESLNASDSDSENNDDNNSTLHTVEAETTTNILQEERNQSTHERGGVPLILACQNNNNDIIFDTLLYRACRYSNLDMIVSQINQSNINLSDINIDLSDEDILAISRLMHAGYDRATAIQVYLAFDRNEAEALRFLLLYD